MATLFKPGWIKPSKILFASEIPPNPKSFAFALAQAREYGAKLILFHAYDMLMVSATEGAGVICYDDAAAARAEAEHLEPLAQKVWDAGVACETQVRPGLPADQILSFLREREIDRLVMGTHSPGRIGRLLVGSAAEAVLRNARIPVYVAGPEVVDARYCNFAVRTILCGISYYRTRTMLACFAAELAAEHHARLVLQRVIRPQERDQVLSGTTMDQIEAELVDLIPTELQRRIAVEPIVVEGDPAEELVYQSDAQQADLIVLGAQNAKSFAAIARHGVAPKVLAHAHCPVITLPQIAPAFSAVRGEKVQAEEVYLAGVF